MAFTMLNISLFWTLESKEKNYCRLLRSQDPDALIDIFRSGEKNRAKRQKYVSREEKSIREHEKCKGDIPP